MTSKTYEQVLDAVQRSGTHTWQDLQEGITAGQFQWWETDEGDAVIVTQIQIWPTTKALCFFLAAGDLTSLKRMMPPLQEWGRQQGCKLAFMVGREGWTRSFLTREMDWRPTAVVLEKTL